MLVPYCCCLRLVLICCCDYTCGDAAAGLQWSSCAVVEISWNISNILVYIKQRGQLFVLLVVFIMAVNLISIQISRVERVHSLGHADEAEKSRLGGCLAVMGSSVWPLESGSKGWVVSGNYVQISRQDCLSLPISADL